MKIFFEDEDLLPKTQRVFLCFPRSTDQTDFLAISRESVNFHHPWVQAPYDEQAYQAYLNSLDFKTYIGFFIRQTSNRQIVGVLNISQITRGVFQNGYLGFYTFAPFAGQGFMSEGLSLVQQTAFEHLKLHRLEANIQPENRKSIKLIQKANFRREGFSPKYLQINGIWRDHERYALTVEDHL